MDSPAKEVKEDKGQDNKAFESGSSTSSEEEPEVVSRKRKWSNVLPGVTYSWQNLNVYAENKNFWGKKTSEVHILKDVTGLCTKGHLLAIMGASGAGKTTLLNVLTYRSVNLKIKGDVRINGKPADPDTLMGISAYVQQVDLFTRVFTVREQLSFHAQLRIGKKISKAERKERIEDVIKDLGLTNCADTLIGEPGRIKGISGGEKKRLAFGCELITNPLLLLCDEPTSGLDSFMAQNVMNTMKAMARDGKTIISTIHQPSSEVFAMFDRLLILAEGRVSFLGSVEEAHKFFNRIERPCPEIFNPGDHFIHTLAVRAGKEEEDKKYIQEVCDNYRNNEGIKVDRMVEAAKIPPTKNALAGLKLSKSPYRSTYKNQFAALSYRAMLEITREPIVTIVKLCQVMFFAFVFGLIYFDQEVTSPKGVQNITGVLFIFVTNLSFSILFPVLTVFSGEMPLFLREHWNGLYRSDAYFISRNLVEFPLYLLLPFLFMSISYYMVGLRPQASYFFIDVGIGMLIAATSVSYGYMISCIASDYNTALVISTPLTTPLMLFGGIYMQVETIPVYLAWLKYLSWFMYGFEALSINQWDQFTILNGTVPVGNYTLDKLSFDPENFSTDLWAMFALAVGYRILAYLFLLLKTTRKK